MNIRNLFLILLALVYPAILEANDYIIINQVMYDSPLNEQTNHPPFSNGEYIELYNGGENSVSLFNWHLTGDASSEWYDFPAISIPPKSFLIIAFRHLDTPSFNLGSVFDLPNTTEFQIIYQNKIILANHGETITLYNPIDDIVDQVTYDGTSHLTKPDRLSADNEGVTSGDQCVSLHRTWVEFDESGIAVVENSQWKTGPASFGECQLAEPSFGEHYITGSQPLPDGENYIISVSPLDQASRVSITDNGISVSNGIRTRTTIQYYDGLGRPVESIDVGTSPNKNDLVRVTDYSGLHLATKSWLPVPTQTEGQFIEVSNIKTQTQNYYSDTRPFTETLYENSALERVVGQKRQGASYESHPSAITYALNDESDNVRIYEVANNYTLKTTGTHYPPYSLHKMVTADEDGKSLTTYTDKLGRKIMEERAGNRTYYVYNKLGYMCFVLPHISPSKLNNGEYPLTDATLKAAAYCYKYDGRGNMIYKRLPGCEEQLMVYDQLGQLVLLQDGNQRLANKWTMCAYDSIGRNLYTAEIELTQTHEELREFFADKWQVEHYGHNYSYPIAGTGYASRLLKNKNLRMLTINYYDNYDYLNILPTPQRQAIRFEQVSGYGLQHDNATGLLTGTRVYNLSEDNTYTATAYYYDTQGRVVQSRSICTNNDYKTAISTEYLFDGSVAQQLTEQGVENDMAREHYRYTYDHAGRLINTFYKLNNNAEITLSSFSYDASGHLVQNLLHNSIDTIRYSYDMRNMLTKTKHRHYSEYLTYADEVGLSGATPCYNGNISVKNEGGSPMGYEYDDMNRLTTVFNYMNKFALGMVRINLEEFSYDEVGNILSLRRKGYDDLAFDYGTEGNQLLSITDSGVDADMYDIIEFSNRALETDSPLLYDANGNLAKDAYRYISRIKYNILNLPDTIQFSNGHQIVNLYDAVGRKYKTVNYTNMRIVNTDYNDIAYYTYDTDSVEYQVTEYLGNIINIRTKEDSVITGKQKIFNATGYYTDGRYYHYVKNHLGSICLVIDSETGSAVQNISYSASGVPSNIDLEIQPYLYNGKEFISQFGLNEYDSQARYYYPVIGRTTTMDPLAENYYHISPYAWCGNNPANAVDPDGRFIWKFDAKGFLEHKLDDNTQDVLRINGMQIAFEFGSIKNVEQDGDLTTFTFGDANVAAEAFKFMADNSEVEYAFLPAETEDSKFITQHVSGKVNVAFNLFEDASSIFAFIHNHPNNTQPSGFIGEEAYGDRKAAQQLVSKLKREIPQYVYRPMYYGQLTPYDTDCIYSNINWGELFSPSGKILTSPLYLRPTVKSLTTTVPTYPTIHIH